jgi:hypothetical protein
MRFLARNVYHILRSCHVSRIYAVCYVDFHWKIVQYFNISYKDFLTGYMTVFLFVFFLTGYMAFVAEPLS